jgi:hypothetical protein
VFRLLLACMPAKKPPISLSPLSLETGAPELGTADFSEVRNVPRPFPKDARERDCYRYLLEQMQAAPDAPHRTKPNSRRPADGVFIAPSRPWGMALGHCGPR